MGTLDTSYSKAKKQLENSIACPALPACRNLEATLQFQEKLHRQIFDVQQKLCKNLPDRLRPQFVAFTPTPGEQVEKGKPNTTEKLAFELDRILAIDVQGKVSWRVLGWSLINKKFSATLITLHF